MLYRYPLLLAFYLLSLPSLTAQAPANDNCSAAAALIPELGTGTVTDLNLLPFTTVGASRSGPDTTCAGDIISRDIWFSVTGTGTSINLWFREFAVDPNTVDATLGYELFDACDGTSIDCGLQDIQRTGGLFRLGDNDLILEEGREYKFRLYAVSDVDFNGISLTVALEQRPANDACQNATPITVAPAGSPVVTTRAVTIGASRSLPSPACTQLSGDDDVFFTFTGTGRPTNLNISNIESLRLSAVALELLEGGCEGESFDCYRQTETGEDETFHLKDGTPLDSGETYVLRIFSQNAGINRAVSVDISLEEADTTNSTQGFVGSRLDHPLRQTTISPNPVMDCTQVAYHSAEAQVGLSVVDLMGRVLVTRQLPGGKGTATLELANYAAGIYIVQISDRSGRFSRRVVRR